MRKWTTDETIDWNEEALKYLRNAYPKNHAFSFDEIEAISYYLFERHRIFSWEPTKACSHLDLWSHTVAYGPCKNLYDVPERMN